MQDIQPKCERCGMPLPDADLSGMLMAEEVERATGTRRLELLCMVCFYYVNTDWDQDDGEPPKVWTF